MVPMLRWLVLALLLAAPGIAGPASDMDSDGTPEWACGDTTAT